MRIILKLLGLVLIDLIVIWICVKIIDPNPSSSIEIFPLAIIPFAVNIYIGGIIYYFKKSYFKLFLINSIISPIVFIFMFNMGISRHLNERLDSWKFSKNDTIFYITKWKETKTFDIDYSLNPGSEAGYLSGNWELKNDSLIFITGKYKMYVLKNKLINFRNDSSEITIDKIKY